MPNGPEISMKEILDFIVQANPGLRHLLDVDHQLVLHFLRTDHNWVKEVQLYNHLSSLVRMNVPCEVKGVWLSVL